MPLCHIVGHNLHNDDLHVPLKMSVKPLEYVRMVGNVPTWRGATLAHVLRVIEVPIVN